MERPIVKTKKGISPIWILPLVALLIGGWLLYKDFQESGIMITVRIKDANGLTIGKTQVMFKGLPVGTLKGFQVTPDLQHIDARIEMAKEAKEKLTSDTKFWVVRPEVSMNRITGLDTLVSGSYFEVQPGIKTDQSHFFNALDEPPPLSERVPGLHLTLQSPHSTSLSPTSPVLFKKVEVGEVISETLQKDGSIETKIIIYPQFMSHITTNSRFYLSSGIQLQADLPKISLQVEPIKAIIRGGVSVETVPGGKTIDDKTKEFPLFKDQQTAQQADDIEIQLTFSVDHGLETGADIRYQGVKIGAVTQIELEDDLKTVRAKAHIDKSLNRLLNENTYIWAVSPRFSLAGVSNLDTVIRGPYLNLIPGSGKPAKVFQVRDARPVNLPESNGLNLILQTDRLGSLGYDKPVYYRQVQVGHTTGYELSATGQNVLIYLNIHEPYVNLIRENTMFWNISGLRIKGGLMTSMKISTESMAAILDGGISFSTPEKEDMGNRVANGHHFTLHSDADDAWLNWSPALELGALPDKLIQEQPKKDETPTSSK
ncbi:MAG: MCE family protein [Proteobacteria bacterium]|nr:MCE family protein [Pseudomonadota bacterium]MBU1419326.1 MCE family protein [Pseudomonadota bacterium]MBU1455157.1 MCE family protein [Pseudomonadota bacterium]